MGIVTILRELWRKRLLVACAAFLAVLLGCGVAFRPSFPPKLKSNKYQVGTATVRMLVDTPRSQVVAVAPTGVDLLVARANLLASLMVDGRIKTAIARRAGLQPAQLDGIAESAPDPIPSAAPKPRGYVLTTMVLNDTALSNPAGNELPIIEIGAQAPDASGAARLANAAVAGLQDYLGSQAAIERVPEARRIRVSSLGTAEATEVVRGPRDLFAVGLAVFIFVAGCGAILVIPALVRDWRAASKGPGLLTPGVRRPQRPALPHARVSLDGHERRGS